MFYPETMLGQLKIAASQPLDLWLRRN